jgi:hypothetical protein
MHYHTDAFARNSNLPTMKGLKGKINPSQELSSNDVEDIRKAYNCKSDDEAKLPS